MDGQGNPYSFRDDESHLYSNSNPPNGTWFNLYQTNLVPTVTPSQIPPPSWNPAWNGLPNYTRSHITSFECAQNQLPNRPYVSTFVPLHLRGRITKRNSPKKPVQTRHIPSLLSIKFTNQDFTSGALSKEQAEARRKKQEAGTTPNSPSSAISRNQKNLITDLKENVDTETRLESSLRPGTIEGDDQQNTYEKSDIAVSSEVGEGKDNNNEQLAKTVCDNFVTETSISGSRMDSSNNGPNMADSSDLPSSSTFRPRTNSGSSDRTEIIPRAKNNSKRTTDNRAGDVLRVTPLGSFNSKLAKVIKREVVQSSDMEGNQSIRGSRSLETLSSLEELNVEAQSSSPVQQTREKLTSGLTSILAKRHKKQNPDEQGQEPAQSVLVNPSTQDSSEMPPRKLSIHEYRNRKRKTEVPASQSIPSTAAEVSSLASANFPTKQQAPVKDSPVLFTRRRSVEQPVQVSSSGSAFISSGTRSKMHYDVTQSLISPDAAYDRRPRGAVPASDPTPPTGQLWASYNAASATANRGSPNSTTGFLEKSPSATSITCRNETSVDSSKEPPAGKNVIVQKPSDLVAVSNIVAPETRPVETDVNMSHPSSDLTSQSDKTGMFENEIIAKPNEKGCPETHCNTKSATTQRRPRTQSSSDEEHYEVERITRESNKENLDSTELCGLDFWNQLIAEDSFSLRIPKMLITDEQIRRDIESMDFSDAMFSEEISSNEAQAGTSVGELLSVEVNAESDSVPSEQGKDVSVKLTEIEKEWRSKSVDGKDNRQRIFDESPQQGTVEPESIIDLAGSENIPLSTEPIINLMDTEKLTSKQPDVITASSIDSVEVECHQSMEVDVIEDVTDPSKVVEAASYGNDGKTPPPPATNERIETQETSEILSEESTEIEARSFQTMPNNETAEKNPEEHISETEIVKASEKQAPGPSVDNSSSPDSRTETTVSSEVVKSTTQDESNSNASSNNSESENVNDVSDTATDDNAATEVTDDGPLRAAAKLKSLMKARPDLYSNSSRSSKRNFPQESACQDKLNRKRISSGETGSSEEPTSQTGIEDSSPTPGANDSSQHPQAIEAHSLPAKSSLAVESIANVPSELQSVAVRNCGSESNYSDLTLREILKPSAGKPAVVPSEKGPVGDRSSASSQTESFVNVCKEVQCELWKKIDICSACNSACKKCNPDKDSIPSCYGPQECFPPDNEEGYRLKKEKLIITVKEQLKMLSSKLENFQTDTSEADPDGLLKGMTDLRHDFMTGANLIDLNVIQFEQMRSKQLPQIVEVSKVNCQKMPFESMPGYLEILFLYDNYSRQEEFKKHADFKHLELFRHRALRALKWHCRANEEATLLSIYQVLAKTYKGWSIEQLTRCWDSVKQFRGELDVGAIEAEYNSMGDKRMIAGIAKIVKKMTNDINRQKQKPTSSSSLHGNASVETAMPSTSGPSQLIASSTNARTEAPVHTVLQRALGLEIPRSGSAQVVGQHTNEAIRPARVVSQPVQEPVQLTTSATLQQIRPSRGRSRTQQLNATMFGPNISPVRHSNYPIVGGMAQIHPVDPAQQQTPGTSGRTQAQVQSVLWQYGMSRSTRPSLAQPAIIHNAVTITPVGLQQQAQNLRTTSAIYEAGSSRHNQLQQGQSSATFTNQVVDQHNQHHGNSVRGPSPSSHPVSVIAGNFASLMNQRSPGIHAEDNRNVRPQLPATRQASYTPNAQGAIDSIIDSYFQDPNAKL